MKNHNNINIEGYFFKKSQGYIMKKFKLLLVLYFEDAEFFLLDKNSLIFFKRFSHKEGHSIKNRLRKSFTGFFAPKFSTSHKFDPHTSLKDSERIRFCKQVSCELRRLVNKLSISAIFISAGPKVLGEFRKHLTPDITKKIAVEITKNLGKLTTKEIEGYIIPIIKNKYQN